MEVIFFFILVGIFVDYCVYFVEGYILVGNVIFLDFIILKVFICYDCCYFIGSYCKFVSFEMISNFIKCSVFCIFFFFVICGLVRFFTSFVRCFIGLRNLG